MGLYSIAVSFREVDQSQVAAAFSTAQPGDKALVSPRTNDYTTLFADRLDSFEQNDVVAVASPVCAELGCNGVGLAVVDSDHLYAWAFDPSGRLAARVWTQGGGPETPDPDRRQAFALIAHTAGRPDTAALLERWFDTFEVLADSKLMKVAVSLGILHFGFTYKTLVEEIAELDDTILPGAADFRSIPTGVP